MNANIPPRLTTLILSVGLGAAAFLSSAQAQPVSVPGLPPLDAREQQDQKDARPLLPSQRYNLKVDAAAIAHDLGAPTVPDRKPSGRLQVGTNRRAGIAHSASGQRVRNADGTEIIVLAIKSRGAVALRLRFTDFEIGAEDEVYVRGAKEETPAAGPYRGKGPWGDREFWSAAIDGETAVIEYHKRGSAGTFVVAEVSHIYQKIGVEDSGVDVLGCEVDASCSSTGSKNAVGRMSFIGDDGGSYVCTGTLLNNSNTDRIPYFLTANHCIATSSEARTLETYWFYQTTSCNSNTIRSDTVRTSQGATLLATSSTHDATLLRLIDNTPSAAAMAGWTSASQSSGTSVYGLHHPEGSYLRRSEGSITSTAGSCLSTGYRVDWGSGTTEGGSSGSGLFAAGTNYLVGVLSCGSFTGTCAGSWDNYGKFANFYPQISHWIFPSTVPLAEALDGGGLTWTTGGTNPWHGQTVTTRDAVDAAISGALGHSQESWVQTTVTGPGTLTFWWKISSEATHDALRFRLNGAEVSSAPAISGAVDWQQRSISIPAGVNTLRWTYAKDASVSIGSDIAWLDQVIFAGGASSRKTDFNADGHGDFVWQNTRTGERVMWFLRNGQYQSGFYMQTIHPEWRIAGTGDLNADGHGDFVWQNIRTGEHVVWFLRNGQYQSGFYFDTIHPEWQIASSADFNADGHADLVWQNSRTGEHVIWLLRNGSYSSGFYFDVIHPEWQIASAADFNADGHADFVWQNTRTGEHVIWLLRNGRYSSGFYFDTFSPAWRIAGAADYNADAHADLVWQNINSGERVMWFMRNGRYQSGFNMQTIHPEWDLCVR